MVGRAHPTLSRGGSIDLLLTTSFQWAEEFSFQKGFLMKIYYDKDASFDILQGKKVGVIGFGSQGHAQAQNLRDSGVAVMVSEVPNTPNYELALKYGFTPVSAADLAKQCQVIQILTQDHVQAQVV